MGGLASPSIPGIVAKSKEVEVRFIAKVGKPELTEVAESFAGGRRSETKVAR